MSDQDSVVVVKDLHKTFKLPHEQHSGIKQALVNIFKGKSGYESQHVLNDVSFEIKKGEFFGIVGKNGSGKSTLLKLLAGIYAPDSGLVKVEGSLTPFIELGVGFNPELTGRENVFMNGALLGFSKTDMEEMYEDIVKFAELDKFMDQKLKNYSSGMQVRLAFSIAVRAKSDILLIDEVLAVGDAAFQAKCYDYFYELKKSDTTVIFISHDRGALEKFCSRGVLIDEGKVIESGSIDKVLDAYTNVVLSQMTPEKSEADTSGEDYKPSAILQGIRLLKNGKSVDNLPSATTAEIEITVQFKEDVSNPVVGSTIWKSDVTDVAVFAANNVTEELSELGVVKKGEVIRIKMSIPNFLNDGEYRIEVGIANDSVTNYYLKEREALRFRVFGSNNPHALTVTSAHMSIEWG